MKIKQNNMAEYITVREVLSSYRRGELDLEEAIIESFSIAGISAPMYWTGNGHRAMLVLEAVNWLAKTSDEDFYEFKVLVVNHIVECCGVECGWGTDGCFHFYHPEVGTLCVHDPFNQIVSKQKTTIKWSGVYRQCYALDILRDTKTRRVFSHVTRPDSALPEAAKNRIIEKFMSERASA